MMQDAFQNPFGANNFNPDNFALKFEVARETLVEDALNQLTGIASEHMNFNMPVRVVFAGEPG
jgi:hypothetical protein